mgnify:CR=1 FL=1
MNVDLKINFAQRVSCWRHVVKIAPALILTLIFTACSTSLQSRVAGNLNQMSKQQTVAILPVEITGKDQKETAVMFRQGLYANLKGSKFNLLERYVVDGLLMQHNLNNPAQFLQINPMQFAEILGVDAVLITRINKVERSYLVIHSSIEIGISAQLVDTRTGEILWRAEQTEQDYQGIAKIPTGISSAILGPIQFVTNKINLHRMTSKLVSKLTAVVKSPEDAEKKGTFKEPLIASATTRDLKKIETVNHLETEWAEDVSVYTEIPSNLLNAKENPLSQSHENSQGLLPSKSKLLMPESEEIPHTRINWTQRKTIFKPVTLEPKINTLDQPNNTTAIPLSAVPTQKLTQNKLSPQYTIQVGAYETKTNASQMANNLSDKGYRARVKSDFKNGAPLFKVHVEEFSDREQADELAKELNNKENLSSFIATVNSN